MGTGPVKHNCLFQLENPGTRNIKLLAILLTNHVLFNFHVCGLYLLPGMFSSSLFTRSPGSCWDSAVSSCRKSSLYAGDTLPILFSPPGGQRLLCISTLPAPSPSWHLTQCIQNVCLCLCLSTDWKPLETWNCLCLIHHFIPFVLSSTVTKKALSTPHLLEKLLSSLPRLPNLPRFM